MVTRDVLKVLKLQNCNFESFQNITRAHKSRNALMLISLTDKAFELSFHFMMSIMYIPLIKSSIIVIEYLLVLQTVV